MSLITLRELWKNAVTRIPPGTLETVINYSVIGHAPELRSPPKVLAEVKKREYFSAVSEWIGPDEPILLLEFGVHRGSSIRRWSEVNRHENSRFIGFDSFVGIPHQWRARPAGYFDVEGRTPDIGDDRVSFVKGWFCDTLHPWLDEHLPALLTSRRLVVHLDADLYHSGLFVLTTLNHAAPSYMLLLDNYSGGEARALRDYLIAYNASFQAILGRKRKRCSSVPGQVFGVLSRRREDIRDG